MCIVSSHVFMIHLGKYLHAKMHKTQPDSMLHETFPLALDSYAITLHFEEVENATDTNLLTLSLQSFEHYSTCPLTGLLSLPQPFENALISGSKHEFHLILKMCSKEYSYESEHHLNPFTVGLFSGSGALKMSILGFGSERVKVPLQKRNLAVLGLAIAGQFDYTVYVFLHSSAGILDYQSVYCLVLFLFCYYLKWSVQMHDCLP